MNGGDGNDTLMPGAHDFASGNAGDDTFLLRQVQEGFPTLADFHGDHDQLVLHLDAQVARDVQLSLREDADGSTLLEVNGQAVGRLLNPEALRLGDIRIVAIGG